MDQKRYDYLLKKFPQKRTFWLENVSRTFTLSIKVLPHHLRNYIGHSYLICRFLDTIEDCENLTVECKREALLKSEEAIRNPNLLDDTYFDNLSKYFDRKWDIILLKNSKDIFETLMVFPEYVQSIVKKWTIEMLHGMQKYAFGVDCSKVQLEKNEDLEDYTYYVAGTVGELLTEIFFFNKNLSPHKKQILEGNAVNFGKALQFVNIIKDSREDFEENRCFIPLELLQENSISLKQFFNKDSLESTKAVYKQLILKAEQYLDNAYDYILQIPISMWKIRLFCIWPVVLAYKTLFMLKNNIEALIKTPKSLKIDRKTVKKTISRSIWAGFSNTYLKYYINNIKSRDQK